ncbi:hypothetical protein [Burkholderia pyrrocinia]|uniref:hypothetical protein n=1 Tax=Burkholderia pyrrocinia TaxID=60550 RepID=UPI0007C7493F|nr:hypothetical protein [Burkholderia pyrrocinia]
MLLMIVMLFSGAAHADDIYLLKSDLTNGYSGCRWRDNGDGTSTINLTVDFKDAEGHTGAGRFKSRAFLVYTYDKNGKVKPSSSAAKNIYLNGAKNTLAISYTAYVIYSSGFALNVWGTTAAFSADVEVILDNNYIKDWPAIGIRAGHDTTSADVAEVKGAAYITPFSDGSTCQVVDPMVPPPASIAIKVTAPDWNLGELPRGDGTKTFVNSAEQLCFTYTGTAVSGRTFVVNASNANGVVNNRYLLKNLTDASQKVPYSVTLNSGTGAVTLPNRDNTGISFSTSGKTCFVPTFKTSVGNLVKEGNYSDVLTFTVVTKS